MSPAEGSKLKDSAQAFTVILNYVLFFVFKCILVATLTLLVKLLTEICFLFSYVEALIYLIYSYQYNKELLSKGLYRGHDEEFLGHFRRDCLLVSSNAQ